MYNDFASFDSTFSTMQTLVFLFFILIFGYMAFMLIRSAYRWNKDNKSPVLTVQAVVVAKRQEISRYHRADVSAHHAHPMHTHHYATFEFESGDRIELRLEDQEYGLLVEGDVGKLTFQGSRYLDFIRAAME